MKTYLYNGGFDSFLTALALALEGGADCAVAREGAATEDLFTEFISAGSDMAAAAAMRDMFERRGSAEIWRHARCAFLSEAEGCESTLLAYARLIKEKGAAADNMLADDRVKRVHDLSASVAGEAHMFKGLVRFAELADKTLYAEIEPDHNILPLLTGHFKARLGTFNWIIHDLRRGKAALYIRGRLIYAPLTQRKALEFAVSETAAQELWRNFFRTAAIKERTNPGLQRGNLPLKYRRHMTEFQ